MPFINLSNEMPGIVGLFAYSPTTAKPLMELAQALLVNSSSLTRGERELIASYVSNLNNCKFCTKSHSAAAAALHDGNKVLVERVKADFATADISEKMKVLLEIAGAVQKSPQGVSKAAVQKAIATGATEKEIHDTILIASAFCMYNRYVDGLQALTPDNEMAYDEMGKQIMELGYLRHQL